MNKRELVEWVFFVAAAVFVLAIVIIGTGCATAPTDPRDPAILHPAPGTYPSPK